MSEKNSIDPKKRDLLKLANSVAHLHDPIRELRERMKAFQFHDPLKEFRESIRVLQMQFHDPLRELCEQMKAFQFHDPLKEFREIIRTTQIQFHDPLKELREQIKAHQDYDHLNIYRNIFRNSIPANTFEEAYQQVLSRFLVEKDIVEGSTDQAAINVIDGIDKEARRIPATRLSLEFYINLLIATIFFIYSQQFSQESEHRLTAKIIETRQIITEQLDGLAINDPPNKHIYYVVLRIAQLRSKPNAGRSNVETLYIQTRQCAFWIKKGNGSKLNISIILAILMTTAGY